MAVLGLRCNTRDLSLPGMQASLLCGMWDLSSLVRDWTHVPSLRGGSLSTKPSGKFLEDLLTLANHSELLLGHCSWEFVTQLVTQNRPQSVNIFKSSNITSKIPPNKISRHGHKAFCIKVVITVLFVLMKTWEHFGGQNSKAAPHQRVHAF